MVLVLYFFLHNNKYIQMKVSEAVWNGLKEQIEQFTEQDKEITDITITYQVRPAVNKNYLKLTVKQ